MSQLIEVKVPDIGDFDAVPVIELFVKVGDTIAVDDAIATLESDKATMDVPSSAAGVVKEVLVGIGDKVGEGTVLIKIEAASAGAASGSTSAVSGVAASASTSATGSAAVSGSDATSSSGVTSRVPPESDAPICASKDLRIGWSGSSAASFSKKLRARIRSPISFQTKLPAVARRYAEPEAPESASFSASTTTLSQSPPLAP